LKQDLLLLSCNQKKINRIHFIQAKLPIGMGGLGLTCSQITAHSASLASFLNCYHDLNYHFNNINFITNKSYSYIHHSISFMVENVLLQNKSKYVFDQLITNYAQSSSTSLKLQNIFSSEMTENLQDKFIKSIEKIPGCNYLTWYTSISNSSSGYFLYTSPKNIDFTFNNMEFSTSLCLRLYLPLPVIPNNQQCLCKNNPKIDIQGHHLITGCKEFGVRQNHHKLLQNGLSKILNYTGFKNSIEESNCFNRFDPFNKQRPDISIHNPQSIGYDNDLLLDISFVSPFSGIQSGSLTNFSIKRAKKNFYAANARFQLKKNKYSEIATANNKNFLPFIIETSGSLHPLAEKFLKDISKVSMIYVNLSYQILYNYIMKTISCIIQKSFASRIFSRIAIMSITPATEKLINSNINDNVGINIINSQLHYHTSIL
jgi:hypothetical protein